MQQTICKWLILFVWLLPVKVMADDAPYIMHLSDTYVVIKLPNIKDRFTEPRAHQFLLSDHLLVQQRLMQSIIPVDVKHHGQDEITTHEVFIHNGISEPVVRVQLIEKKQIEYGYTYIAQVQSNIPADLVSKVTVKVNGSELDVSLNTPFFVESYESTLVIDSSLTISRYKTITNSQSWTHRLPQQFDCDMIYEPPFLDAVCFTNREPILQVDFYLDGFPIGRHGRVEIGQDIPDALTMVIVTKSQTLYYQFEHSFEKEVHHVTLKPFIPSQCDTSGPALTTFTTPFCDTLK